MRILGTGSALPEHIVSNDDLAQFLDTSDEWISTRTGIRVRHVLSSDHLADLAVTACKRALESAGIEAEALDMIICSTVQAEAATPALACIVQGAIGAHCPGFDINSGCTGFLAALDTADAMLAAGKAERILVFCAEAMTRLCDWTDRSTCVLFGDGAGAVVVDGGAGFKAINLTTASNDTVLNAYTHYGNSPFAVDPVDFTYMHMNGQEVYKFAVSQSCAGIRKVLDDAGLSPDQVQHYLLHQANLRILEAARTRLKLGPERFPHNIEETGNTSSASIPILLDKLNREGALQNGERMILSAFGAGLCTGTALLEWNA